MKNEKEPRSVIIHTKEYWENVEEIDRPEVKRLSEN